jgi:hypothetical protein
MNEQSSSRTYSAAEKTYVVTWNDPAALGHELLGALVDIWASSSDVVLQAELADREPKSRDLRTFS